MEERKSSLATSLFKGLDLLTLLNANPQGSRINEVVAKMDLPRSSVVRMLNSLEHYGLVARNEERRFHVTESFEQWRISQPHEELRAQYQPLVESVCAEIGELTLLGRLEGRLIQHIFYAEPDHRIRVLPMTGQEFPLTNTVMGKLVLSQRPDLIPAGCSQQLLDEIREAGQTGYAWNRAESEPGVIAWGTWLEKPGALSPVISVVWPEFRFSEDARQQFATMVNAHKAEAEKTS